MRIPYGVGNWKAIRNLWEEFTTNTGFRIGNGRMVSFWHDDWIGHGALKDLFPDLFNLTTSPNATVEETWSSQGWNLIFRRLLNDWEVTRATEILKMLEGFAGLSEAKDSLTWKGGSSSKFTVNAAYNYLSSRGHPNYPWPWKKIWKIKAPFKVICFSWLLVRKACLTLEILQRRGIQTSSTCFLCQQEEETNEHLFLHCVITRQLWQLFIALAGIVWVMPKDTIGLICSWNSIRGRTCHKEWWKIVPACIWWTVWKERNARCFEGESSSTQKIKSSCISLFHFLCKEQLIGDVESLLDLFDSL